MKQRQTIILFTIISMLLIIFTNCSEDDQYQEQINERPKIFNMELSGMIVAADSIFQQNKNLRQRVNSLFSTSNLITNRLTSDLYGFSIDTSYVQIIKSENFESFTFVAQMQEQGFSTLDNYVITFYDNGSYTQLLVSYPIISENDDNYSYDISNMTVQVIDDENLLSSVSCGYSYQEIIEWEETCIPIPLQQEDIICRGNPVMEKNTNNLNGSVLAHGLLLDV